MSFKLGEKDASHQSQELESSLLSSLQVCWILRPYSHLEMETSGSDLHVWGFLCGSPCSSFFLPSPCLQYTPLWQLFWLVSYLSQDLWRALWFLKALPSCVTRESTYAFISQSQHMDSIRETGERAAKDTVYVLVLCRGHWPHLAEEGDKMHWNLENKFAFWPATQKAQTDLGKEFLFCYSLATGPSRLRI